LSSNAADVSSPVSDPINPDLTDPRRI
jgi:hypothetical protein